MIPSIQSYAMYRHCVIAFREATQPTVSFEDMLQCISACPLNHSHRETDPRRKREDSLLLQPIFPSKKCRYRKGNICQRRFSKSSLKPRSTPRKEQEIPNFTGKITNTMLTRIYTRSTGLPRYADIGNPKSDLTLLSFPQ